jgi:Uma2 family endonuclease
MWGLEYAYLFGVPNNKLELDRGRSRCAFPFQKRQEAEAHFQAWLETLCHWKGVDRLPASEEGLEGRQATVAGMTLRLAPLPIELWTTLEFEAFETLYFSFWRRDLWDNQPAGREWGYENIQRHSDVRLNLWTLLGKACKELGGVHAGQVDVALTETSSATPDQLYFSASRDECMIEDEYFHGAPDLIAEVLSPATRGIDRGPRKDVYRRAGVRHLWLLDPEPETVELYELAGAGYCLAATHGVGASFQPALFPGLSIVVDDLFDTQWKRFREGKAASGPQPVPAGLVPAEKRLGLEYLLLLGHPERRREIWNNRTPCVLAFGSPEEARLRFTHFLEDVCRWEQAPTPRPSSPEADAEQAEVGRFCLTRRGRRVHLDVAVDGRKYRELLEVSVDREAWDWGED